MAHTLWLLALLCVLTYAGYQIYLSYLSYTNPDWYKFLECRFLSQTCDDDLWRRAAGVLFERELDFPAVLVCPKSRTNNGSLYVAISAFSVATHVVAVRWT